MLTVAEFGEERAAAGIPDTLQALIAARIDRLDPGSKSVLQRASVIGRGFWAGAIEHLSNGESAEDALEDLQLRDLVVHQPRSSLSNEKAYRFKHVLIRDVAYASLTKSARAAHHARFAEWLGERAGDELLEIRAHHLDHAASLLADLDGAPPADLAREAAATLQEAGRRALAREANQAARNSFLRALELEPTLERRYLAAKAAWRLDDLPAVAREMEPVREEAARIGDRRPRRQGAGRARRHDPHARGRSTPGGRGCGPGSRGDRRCRPRSPVRRSPRPLECVVLGGHLGEAETYLKRADGGCAGGRAEGSGKRRPAHAGRNVLGDARPGRGRGQARARARARRGERHHRSPRQGAAGVVEDLPEPGHLEQAETAIQEAQRLFSEAGAVWAVARALNLGGWVAWESGDLEKGEKRFRESIRLLKPLGDRAHLCESQRGLAELLLQRGRVEEAERFALRRT